MFALKLRKSSNLFTLTLLRDPYIPCIYIYSFFTAIARINSQRVMKSHILRLLRVPGVLNKIGLGKHHAVYTKKYGIIRINFTLTLCPFSVECLRIDKNNTKTILFHTERLRGIMKRLNINNYSHTNTNTRKDSTIFQI